MPELEQALAPVPELAVADVHPWMGCESVLGLAYLPGMVCQVAVLVRQRSTVVYLERDSTLPGMRSDLTVPGDPCWQLPDPRKRTRV